MTIRVYAARRPGHRDRARRNHDASVLRWRLRRSLSCRGLHAGHGEGAESECRRAKGSSNAHDASVRSPPAEKAGYRVAIGNVRPENRRPGNRSSSARTSCIHGRSRPPRAVAVLSSVSG